MLCYTTPRGFGIRSIKDMKAGIMSPGNGECAMIGLQSCFEGASQLNIAPRTTGTAELRNARKRGSRGGPYTYYVVTLELPVGLKICVG